MKNLPEELIYVLIFGAILLVQFLMKRFVPQPQPQPQPQPSSPQDELVAETAAQMQAALQDSAGSAASETGFGRSPTRGTAPASARHRFSRKALLANRRDVQNAIVLATIIGPCRAFEPHEVR